MKWATRAPGKEGGAWERGSDESDESDEGNGGDEDRCDEGDMRYLVHGGGDVQQRSKRSKSR